jgi:hypothetical protein
MRNEALRIPFVFSAVVLLGGCCMFWPDRYPDKCCYQNVSDDGVQPTAGFRVSYKPNGRTVNESYNSTMAQPSGTMGFTVSIPRGVPYTLALNGKDEGGVGAMKLTAIEYANTSTMPVIRPRFTISDKDLTSCIVLNRLYKHESDPHDDKRISYELTVTDVAGSSSTIKLTIIPEIGSGGGGTSCQQTGTISKWLNWNNNLENPRWSGTLGSGLIAGYCDNVRIKKVEFDIYTDCDSIISSGWHIRVGSNQYDGLSDTDTGSDKHVHVEVNVLIPLGEWPIEVWSNHFVLTDYTYPNCGTDKLPNINIDLHASQ